MILTTLRHALSLSSKAGDKVYISFDVNNKTVAYEVAGVYETPGGIQLVAGKPFTLPVSRDTNGPGAGTVHTPSTVTVKATDDSPGVEVQLKPMKTNDLKKGDRVLLRNGWYATIADNLKGNTRLATVEGYVTETGSVYSHDIMTFYPQGEGGPFVEIEHTPAQLKLRKQVEGLGL